MNYRIDVQVTTRTPWNQLPIALVYASTDRKIYRDQYCIECGKPFVAISDKYIAIQDSGAPIELLREDQKVIEARCKNHYCKQHYRVFV